MPQSTPHAHRRMIAHHSWSVLHPQQTPWTSQARNNFITHAESDLKSRIKNQEGGGVLFPLCEPHKRDTHPRCLFAMYVATVGL